MSTRVNDARVEAQSSTGYRAYLLIGRLPRIECCQPAPNNFTIPLIESMNISTKNRLFYLIRCSRCLVKVVSKFSSKVPHLQHPD